MHFFRDSFHAANKSIRIRCCDFVCNLISALGAFSYIRNTFPVSVSEEGMTPPACSVALTFLWPLLRLCCCSAVQFGTDFPTFRNCGFSEATSRFHWGPLSQKGAAFLFDEPVYLFPSNNPVRYFQKSWRSNMIPFPPIVKHRAMRRLRTVNSVSPRPYLHVSATNLTLSLVSITSYVGRSVTFPVTNQALRLLSVFSLIHSYVL